MLKTVFLLAGVLVIIVIVCLIDISSIFLDDGTTRLLYYEDSQGKSDSNEDSEDLEQQQQQQERERGKTAASGERESDLATEIARQFGQSASMGKEKVYNNHENDDVIDLQATLNDLDKQIRSNQTVGVVPENIREVANEFANEIIEEWQG